MTGPDRLGRAQSFGWLAIGLVTVLALIGGWSARTLLAPPGQAEPAAAPTTATAEFGTVERSLSLSAEANWVGGAQRAGLAAGTVTALGPSAPARIRPGTILYEVDLVPVVAASGSVPAFRDLRSGDVGPDVAQLQEFLRAEGAFLKSTTGRFDGATVAAVRRWQLARQQPRTGVVKWGTVLFLGELPAIGAITDAVILGQPAPVGVAAYRSVPDSPRFTIQLPPNQASIVRAGMPVRLEHGGAVWRAAIESMLTEPDGAAKATLGPAGRDGSICGTGCGALSLNGTAGIPASIQVTPRTSGTTVPTAALVGSPTGGAAVITDDGHSVPVVVVQSSGGIAVVEGLRPGMKVRVGRIDS